MKKWLFLFTCLIIHQTSYSQNFQTQFERAFNAKDIEKAEQILMEWETNNPKNPELYTSYFNFYALKAREETYSINTSSPNKDALSLSDSSGKNVGHLTSEINFDSVIMQNGIEKISKGIELFPNRLDMRFGKIYMYGEMGKWDLFTQDIIQVLDKNQELKGKWLWSNNAPFMASEEEFLSSIQDYQNKIYNTEKDQLLPYMRTIALKVIEYHPKHTPSYSNVGLTYYLEGNLKEALVYFLNAEMISPDDTIVLINIAQTYIHDNKLEKAKSYFEKAANVGDEQIKKYANQMIQVIQTQINAKKE
ncbi:tetratricopeptide repeat protein [bacterium]|nr:MAG: tetratricopeptide repeat protein [bacterium]